MNSETPISLLDAAIYELDQCEWPGCPEPATVHHLASESEFCNRHFRRYDREHSAETWEEVESAVTGSGPRPSAVPLRRAS